MSTADKAVTEREAVVREQAAFKDGARALYYDESVPSDDAIVAALHRIEDAASTRYPLPELMRRRVVTDRYGVQWKIDRGALLNFDGEGDWTSSVRRPDGGILSPTLDRVKLWADLLANPTEEVEE